jgi:hypothetical protein
MMTTFGNVSLLDKPKHGFLCSRTTKSSVILPCLDWAVEHAKSNEVVMSTFHSELEEAVLDILLTGKCPIILVLGRSIYKTMPEKLQLLLDQNRLLIISLSDQGRISRESAFRCNKYICNQSDSLTFGFLSKDSSLYTSYQETLKKDIQTNVISSVF